MTHERFAAATCEEGHKFTFGTSEPSYALLYERALQRFVDGDLRDALLDAYTAFDMYMPSVPIRARYDADPQLGVGDIERLRKEFKPVTKDATSAGAAGLAAVAVQTRSAPPNFDTKLSGLRNRAVHAGQYPTPDEAEWAILEVERLVTTIDDMLTAAAPDRDPSFREAVEWTDFRGSQPGTAGHVSLSFSTVLSGTMLPRESVRRRLERYRSGELALRLY